MDNKQKEKKYRFSCGDSTKGAIGFCALVTAPTRRVALTRLRDFLAANSEIDLSPALPDDIEYCRVYIEGDNVRRSDISDIDEVDYRVLDAENLYHRVIEFLKNDSEINGISDKADELLADACRAMAGEPS